MYWKTIFSQIEVSRSLSSFFKKGYYGDYLFLNSLRHRIFFVGNVLVDVVQGEIRLRQLMVHIGTNSSYNPQCTDELCCVWCHLIHDSFEEVEFGRLINKPPVDF